jgi:hypothetical protein
VGGRADTSADDTAVTASSISMPRAAGMGQGPGVQRYFPNGRYKKHAEWS